VNAPYKIGTLARLTGFSPMLLRAWERRFKLIVPGRGEGRQRLYTDEDLAVLTHVRALVDEGRSIGEIARLGRQALLATPPARAHERRDRPPVEPVGGETTTATVEAWRLQLVEAALAMDAGTIARTLDEVFATVGADRAVMDVIEPVAIQIGDLWMAGRCSVASEHLVSGHFQHRLGRLLDAAQPQDEDAPQVVAACFPEERHELGLLILSWHVARHGVRIAYLGAALPASDLAKACRTLRPQATLLSVTQPHLFRRHQTDLVKRVATGALGRVFVGGQGLPERPGGRSRAVRYLHAGPMPALVRHVMASLAGSARSRRTATANAR